MLLKETPVRTKTWDVKDVRSKPIGLSRKQKCQQAGIAFCQKLKMEHVTDTELTTCKLDLFLALGPQSILGNLMKWTQHRCLLAEGPWMMFLSPRDLRKEREEWEEAGKTWTGNH